VGTIKRRPESRSRAKRSKPQIGKQPREEYHWVPEALAIVFGSAAAFLCLSLLVQQESISNLFNLGENSGRTFGPVGSFLGVMLFGAFGWSSMMFVAWLSFLAVRAWREELVLADSNHSRWVIFAGSVGIVLAASSTAAILGGSAAGGDVGVTVSGPLTTLVSKTGALLASLTIFVLAVSFTLGRSLTELARTVWDVVTDVAVLVFVTIPVLLLRCAKWGFYQLVNAVALVLEAMFAPEVVERFRNIFARPENSKPAITVKPSVRKNVIKTEDEAEEDEDIVDEDEIEYEVQVNRRTKDDKVSLRELQKVRKKMQEESPAADIFYSGTYSPPEITLLAQGQPAEGGEADEDLVKKSRQIEGKLKDFGILGRVTEVHPGPVITLFEFEPAAGVKVGRIAALSDDLSMTLRAVSVRIVAPIPGKGTVGIEVPNVNREVVRLRDVLESQECVRATSSLTIGLGKDTYGNAVVADIARMPHLLIAGATGTGKSVCINAILLSLLYRATPAELGLIMIDPKILELSVYDGIPHLRVPVVTVPKQAKAVLEWAVHEMHRRYRLMQKLGVRSIDAYNRVVRGEDDGEGEEKKTLSEEIEIELTEAHVVDGSVAGESGSEGEGESENEEISTPGEQLIQMPKIVIVIDELADLMLTVGREVEDLITRLAQKARAAGIHLIVATQRPSVDVITGLIKANFPARLSFQVSSRVDSRTIIDGSGAEKLLGQGDMLFMPPGVGSLRRVHGAFVADAEVKRVVAQLKKDCKPVYDAFIQELCDKAMKEEPEDGQGEGGSDEHDDLYDQAVRIVLEKGKASTSLIQRHLRIGYNRAARIIEMMEREGLVGPADGAKPREVIGSGANDI
jgi:S-DNA-T family DNA segregation ATPase FtsK/SpoIIIE